jgi:hypothetical protein
VTARLPLPPVITIRPAAPGEDGNVCVPCECGAAARLVIEGLERLTQRRELAVTCDGCQKVTWYVAGPPGEVAP